MPLPRLRTTLSVPEIRRFVDRDDPVILELGAHDGADTLKFLQGFPRSVVHCFECDPRPLARFKANPQLQDYMAQGRLFLYELAVSDRCGPQTFNQSGGQPKPSHPVTDWDYSGSLLPPTGHLRLSPWCTFTRAITVQTTTLDDWYQSLASPPLDIDLIWSDVQGAEHLMIAGAAQVLRHTRYLYEEFYDQPQYAGQQPMAILLSMLGATWEPLAIYEGNNFLAVNHVYCKSQRLQILETPEEFRQPPRPYPSHSTGLNIEGAFYEAARMQRAAVSSDWIYLPIFWQCNYWQDAARHKTPDVGAIAAVQEFLDSRLDPRKKYFTVSQADEGTYERLPPNVLVFSAGGNGHVPIPLLCDPHPTQPDRPRDLLASFLGQIETGGPFPPPEGQSASRSSWHQDGRGALVRRRMRTAFLNQPDCHIQDARSARSSDVEHFCDLVSSSRFALCPRGYGKTSYRLYEAIQLGAVPVYIFDEPWLPYAEQIYWNEFCVLCPAAELEGLPDRLRGIPADHWLRMQRYGQELYTGYFTRPGVCNQILDYIRN